MNKKEVAKKIPMYKEPHYKAHKATGGTMYFHTDKHPDIIKTKKRDAERKGREESFNKFMAKK